MAAPNTKLTNLTVTGNLTVGGTCTGSFGGGSGPTKVGSGAFSGSWTSANGGAVGTTTVTVTGALTTDTVLITITSPSVPTGSGPVNYPVVEGAITTNGTMTVWNSNPGNGNFYSAMTFNWMVLR